MKLHRATVAATVIVLGTIGACLSDLGMAIVRPRSLSVLDSYVHETRLAPFPRRAVGALGGRALLERTAKLSAHRRENALVAEIMAGNVPDHLRTLVPVRLTSHDRNGRVVTGTAWVLPDYLAVGSNDDFVRVPMSMAAASKLALHFGMALPTSKIVNDIYQAADLKLSPAPLPPTRMMTSNAYTIQHNDMIEHELAEMRADGNAGRGPQLIAGHKKDVVMTPRLGRVEGRVAIFGWHRLNGKPIQPLSTVHDRNYADYSHGVRLVSAAIFVDGRDVQIEDALVDRSLAPLLSNEGRFPTYAALLETGAYGESRSRLYSAAATLRGAIASATRP
jgi:hypothetical protein